MIKNGSLVLAGLLFGILLSQLLTSEKTESVSPRPITREIVKTVISDTKNNPAELNKLKELLSNSNEELGYLLQVNQELENQLAEIEASSEKEQVLIDKIDELPESFIDQQLKKQYGFESLDNIEDTREFSKNLVKAAFDNEDYDKLDNISIYFSYSPTYKTREFSGSIDVGSNDTLFAFIANEGDTKDVMVKWHNTQTGKLISFKNISLSSSPQNNYISARPDKGWQPGQYRITVYNVNQQVSPLGSKSYTVATVSNIENNSTESIIQELIATGQAIPKQPSN